jgi:hypothetical protein
LKALENSVGFDLDRNTIYVYIANFLMEVRLYNLNIKDNYREDKKQGILRKL